ncbi:hypothetical protein [Moritella viscosa]|uniref:hypothetical protein n=1 Tax=Moritella viscosa TaxID=80854 RepID=UPI0009103FEB|nr:hypothetical protein [Moritella viscosa]SGY98771.1 Putative uncharacterized protein [Moritella viscosa]
MGGGGTTQSTNQTYNTNTSGSSAISGDNLGTVLAGVNVGKGASLNMTTTDHGAVRSATELGKKAIEANAETFNKAFDFGKDALKENSTMAQKAMAENGAVSRGAMDNMQKNSAGSISAVKAMAVQSGENARAALAVAENTASRSQIGAAGEMSKVAIAVMVVLGMGFGVMAIKGAK